MRRRIRPVAEYQEHEQYPSAEEGRLSRRAFLRRAAVTTGAVAGAMAVADRAAAAPAPKDKRAQITLYLDRWHRIGSSGLRAERLVVFTADKKLAGWLRDYKEQTRIRAALMKEIRKAKEDVLYDGRKLFLLERKLGAVLAAQYRLKKGRRAAQPDVMMHVSRYYRRLMGKMPSPRWPRP